jgi:hypothetical protein
MLLKNRVPGIEHRPVKSPEGLEHLRSDWVAILRWLVANKVEHVVVGAVADAIRGNAKASGPVAIVPAPYRRNLERLAKALASEHARLRVETKDGAGADPVPVKLTAEKLQENMRWTLRCGVHDLDVEGGIRAAGGDSGVPSYQELLYEAGRFELEQGLRAEVASPEDIEHYAHLRRTGVAPEIRITRQRQEPAPPQADAPEQPVKADPQRPTE